MKQRCSNKKDKAYKHYGGRGITVCASWLKFENFYADMIATYRKGLMLDRIDNDKGYNPQNCRWATRKEQMNNRSNNIIYKGERPIEAAKRLGLNSGAIYCRLNLGWTLEEAFTTPKRD